ncbi:MAG: helix-turn-helix transcriptional regulator [Arenicella sp.]
MGRGSSLGKLERLDQLLGKLKAGETHTSGALADELEVSLRTLTRDLQTLRNKGYPIETDKGRGGGVRLYPRWGIGRMVLNYREVIDLLLAMSILEKLNSPLFLSNLTSVRNKLYATFPDTQRPQIRLIRKRILIGELASNHIMKSYIDTKSNQQTDDILKSFIEQKCIKLQYQREDGEVSQRTIEVHYLFLNWPAWYLISFDHMRNAPRMFRVDRVQSTKLMDDRFQLKPIEFFSTELEQYSTRL